MRNIEEMKRIDEQLRLHDASIVAWRKVDGTFSHYELRGNHLNPQVVRDMICDGWIEEQRGEIFRRKTVNTA